MKNTRSFLLYLFCIILESCNGNENIDGIPSTSSATELNGGWFEILLKEGDQEIAIYLRSLAEGDHIIYSIAKPDISGYPTDLAIATVIKGDRVFTPFSGVVRIKGTSEIECIFEFQAKEMSTSGSQQMTFSGRAFCPVTKLLFETCLLEKINTGLTDSTTYIYGLDKKVVMELKNYDSKIYYYKDGILWPSIHNAAGQILNYNKRSYLYDINGRVIAIENYPISQEGPYYSFKATISYDNAGNIMRSSTNEWVSHNSEIRRTDYAAFDSYKNPNALLSQSWGVPQIFSNNNPITASVSATGEVSSLYQLTYTYDYNVLGFPKNAVIKRETTSGAYTWTERYSYIGCN